jgi:hypothetical protein
MATNREMLKEAIADAKAVKETAIANAKVALEEAFTPQLKSMFAAKLQEMASDKDDLEEAGFGNFDTKDNAGFSKMGDKALDEMNDEKMMEVDLEELLRELELEEDDTLNEAEEEEEPEESEESEESDEEGEPLDLEDLTDEDLKDMIEDVIKDMIEKGELEAGNEGMEDEESEESEEEEEVDLAELLREIEEMDYMEETETVNEGGMSSIIVDLFGNDGYVQAMAGIPIVATAFGIAAGLVGNAYRKFKKEEKLKSMKDSEVAKLAADDTEFINSEEGKAAAQKLKKETPTNETELYEAYSTIKILKSELNEINLLNAKLLYTNKIFKAKNLNESQKVKVLTSFDRAKNVGEVKMVFETLNEGIKVSKNIIKENLGRASKGTMTPNVKKPIVESNEAFLRMQKLAGLI